MTIYIVWLLLDTFALASLPMLRRWTQTKTSLIIDYLISALSPNIAKLETGLSV